MFLPRVGCDIQAIITLICFTTAFMGFNSAAFIPSFIDISPKYSGVLHSVANVLFAAEGFMVPHFLSLIISSDPYGTEGWAPVWIICSLISVTGALVFIVFGNSEAAQWPNEWEVQASYGATSKKFPKYISETHHM